MKVLILIILFQKQKLKIQVLDMRIKYRNNKIQLVGKII